MVIAKEAFETLLTSEEPGETLFGLGVAQWWLGETEASLRHRERAYAAFRRRPNPEHALLAAFWLCLALAARERAEWKKGGRANRESESTAPTVNEAEPGPAPGKAGPAAI